MVPPVGGPSAGASAARDRTAALPRQDGGRGRSDQARTGGSVQLCQHGRDHPARAACHSRDPGPAARARRVRRWGVGLPPLSPGDSREPHARGRHARTDRRGETAAGRAGAGGQDGRGAAGGAAGIRRVPRSPEPQRLQRPAGRRLLHAVQRREAAARQPRHVASAADPPGPHRRRPLRRLSRAQRVPPFERAAGVLLRRHRAAGRPAVRTPRRQHGARAHLLRSGLRAEDDRHDAGDLPLDPRSPDLLRDPVRRARQEAHRDSVDAGPAGRVNDGVGRPPGGGLRSGADSSSRATRSRSSRATSGPTRKSLRPRSWPGSTGRR